MFSVAVTVINAGESSMASKYSVSSSSSLASSLRSLTLPFIRTYTFVNKCKKDSKIAEPSHGSEFVFYRVQGTAAHNHIPMAINQGIISLVKLAMCLLVN